MFSLTIHNNEDITDWHWKNELFAKFSHWTGKGLHLRLSLQPKLLLFRPSRAQQTLWKPAKRCWCPNKRTRSFPRTRYEWPRSFDSFRFVVQVVQTFDSHGFSADLNATYLLRIARDKLPNPIKLKWTEHVVDNDWTNPGLTELSDWMDRQSRAFEQLQDTFSTNTNNHLGQQNQPQGSSSFNNRNKNKNRTNWTQNFPLNKSFNPSNKSFEHNSTGKRNIEIAKPQQSTANGSDDTKGSYFSLVQSSLWETQHQTRAEQNARLINKITTLASVNSFSVSMSADAIAKQRRTLCASIAAKNCTSKVLCRHCNGKHHSLLHTSRQKAPE